MFELRVLGVPEVLTAGGEHIDLPLGKPLAALCYVALEPGPVRRSDLAMVLWSNAPDQRARASVRQALWLIRQHTDPGLVIERGGLLEIAPDLLTTDLEALEVDLLRGRLDSAWHRWRGGPLRDLGITNARGWMAWADEVRNRWEAHLGSALEAEAERGGADERLLWLERALSVRPHRVEAHLSRVRTYVELRDVTRAEAALQSLREVADVGSAKLVREAEERVRFIRRAVLGDSEDRLAPEFVGRSLEFSVCAHAWRRVLAGGGSLVAVVGPSGIGKTALAQEILGHARLDSAAVVEARAQKSEQRLSFGLVASLVAQLLRLRGAAGTSLGSAQLLGALVPSQGVRSAQASLELAPLADALADLVTAVSEEAPILIHLDDCHWIDDVSARVLLRAFGLLNGTRAFLILTGQVGRAATPWNEFIGHAPSHGWVRVLELGPLSAQEVRQLVTFLLPAAEPTLIEDFATQLSVASEGSPLALVELLHRVREEGCLRRSARHGWVIETTDAQRALELLTNGDRSPRSQTHPVSFTAFQVGRAIAEAPTAMHTTELVSATGLDEEGVSGALRELLDRGFVQLAWDGRPVAANPKLMEDLLAGAVRAKRRSRWAVPFLAAAVVALLVGLSRTPSPEPSLFGEGTLWLRSTDSVWLYEATSASPALTRVEAIPIPRGFLVTSYTTLLTGERVLGGMSTGDPGSAPAAVVLKAGVIDTVFDGPGDDWVRMLRPQGDWILLSAQHPDTAEYRIEALRVSTGLPDEVVVLNPGGELRSPLGWSRDGRWILMHVGARLDSLLAVDPAGRILHALEVPDSSLAWSSVCGPSQVLGGSLPERSLPSFWRWTLGESVVEPVRTSEPVVRSPNCSPNGQFIAYLTTVGGEHRVQIDDERGVPVASLSFPGQALLQLYWEAGVEEAPVTVLVEAPQMTVKRGDRVVLDAQVLGHGGELLEREVHWSSKDPSIASVNARGLVTGNRPGVTSIRALVDGWLNDSAVVTVTSAATGSTLALSDSFVSFDSSVWVTLGEDRPTPEADSLGRPFLRLDGDGRFSDGILTSEAFNLSDGGRLEARVLIQGFSRVDRQRVDVCLLPEPLVPSSVNPNATCLRWPYGEGVDQDRGALLLAGPSSPLGKIREPGLLHPGEWVTLGIEVRPDGEVTALVGDSAVAVHPIPLTNLGDRQFHVAIRYATVDTEILLRDVILWLGTESAHMDSATAPRSEPPGLK